MIGIELWMSNVMDYLTDTIRSEEEGFERLVKTYFNYAHRTNYLENESMREYLLELREIKRIYMKGKPFVRNLTLGKKKGITTRWYNLVHTKDEAEEHLEFIKRWYSERTYYRHKKRLKTLVS